MPLTKIIRSRGATSWVTAHGEVLFAIGGDVTQWSRNFSRRAIRLTSQMAPSNKRPRWAHYGKPLKRTFTSTTKPVPSSLMVHTAIGSRAAYSAYVDQGTGVYGGNGPYDAKILPPWTRQSPSLYEHTWKVPRSAGVNMHGERVVEWEEVGTIKVKGQRGQQFFDKGLRAAFSSVGMPTLQVPGEPKALQLFPERLANFQGNTPVTGAFIAQLQEWREWRDRAWYRGDVLGLGINKERQRRELALERKKIDKATGGSFESWQEKKARARARAQRYRDRKRLDTNKPKRQPSMSMAQKADRASFLVAMERKYGSGNVERHSVEKRGGYWYVTVRVPNPKRRGQFLFTEVRAKAKT